MPKQSRFLCIGGFLNGTQVKDQGDSFVCVENGKQVTYTKKKFSIKTLGIMTTMSVKPPQTSKHATGFMIFHRINDTRLGHKLNNY